MSHGIVYAIMRYRVIALNKSLRDLRCMPSAFDMFVKHDMLPYGNVDYPWQGEPMGGVLRSQGEG